MTATEDLLVFTGSLYQSHYAALKSHIIESSKSNSKFCFSLSSFFPQWLEPFFQFLALLEVCLPLHSFLQNVNTIIWSKSQVQICMSGSKIHTQSVVAQKFKLTSWRKHRSSFILSSVQSPKNFPIGWSKWHFWNFSIIWSTMSSVTWFKPKNTKLPSRLSLKLDG